MLALCIIVSSEALAPRTTLLPPAKPVVARSDAASIQLRIPSDEKKESVKAGGLAALSGCFVSLPVISSKAGFELNDEFAWSIGSLAVELAVFGLVYRLAMRCDACLLYTSPSPRDS